jgi:hypothetical protein
VGDKEIASNRNSKNELPFHPGYFGSELFNTNDPLRRLSFIIMPIQEALDFRSFLGLFDATNIVLLSSSERDAAGLIG